MANRSWRQWLTTAEVATRFRVPQDTVCRWASGGKLKYETMPDGSFLLEPDAAVLLAEAYHRNRKALAEAQARPKPRKKRKGPPANVCRAGLEPDPVAGKDPIAAVAACDWLTPADHAELSRRKAKFEEFLSGRTAA